jgi:hypothetical protein
MDYVAFYSRTGKPIAWIGANSDFTSIFLINGRPVAWIDSENTDAYSGRYLGWMQDGWVFDRAGDRAFFTSTASGGPAKPAHGARGARPARVAREARPARPARSQSWTVLSDESSSINDSVGKHTAQALSSHRIACLPRMVIR